MTNRLPLKIFLVAFVLLFVYQTLPAAKPLWAKEKIIFFWQQGCPHCAKVESFLQKEKVDRSFNIERKEIYFNKKNRREFSKLCEKFHIPLEKRGVPLALIEGKCYIGDREIIDVLRQKLQSLTINPPLEHQKTTGRQTGGESSNSENLNLPLVIGAAAVDAINPCAFAVLIILMATVLATAKRKKALLSGLAFALAIFISYLMMGLGVYKVLAAAAFSSWFIKVIAAGAIIIGLLNLKDYFWYGAGGFLMEVPRKWRPRMKALIQSVVSPPGAFGIGFLVSLFLLPCSSGPYIVILGMLSQKENFLPALFWLILYNIVFIVPMIIITLAVYFGLDPARAEKIRTKKLKLLHLAAGILMLAMGIVILLRLA